MKYAITLASFKDIEEIATTLSRISKIGFDAVEMYGEPELMDLQLVEVLGTYDIPVCGITGMWGKSNGSNHERVLLTSDRTKLTTTENYVKGCVEMCRSLGGGHLNICLFADQEISIFNKTHCIISPTAKAKMYDLVSPCLKELAMFAHDRGVKLLLEPLNRYSTPYCGNAEDARSIISKVDREDLSLVLDTFHMNIEEDSFEQTISQSKGWLEHMHFADNNRKMPGFAHIDFEEIMRTLQMIGYNRFVTFEPTIPVSSSEDYEFSLEKGITLVKSLMAAHEGHQKKLEPA